MTLTAAETELWGSSNDWSSAITGASARLLKLPWFAKGSISAQAATATRIAREYLADIERGRSTSRVLYSGHARSPEWIQQIESSGVVQLPLTALSPDASFARGFARGGGVAVLMRFEKGIRAMRYSSIEWITAGPFLVRSVRRGQDPFWKTSLVTVTMARLA